MLQPEHKSTMLSKFSTCSILFSDIRNFTQLTRKLGAIQVVDLLNEYLNSMVTPIYSHKGILDKFMGDAIMAVFGLPYTQDNDATNAVKCALDMIEILKDFNKNPAFNNDLTIGIGISTGNVVSGNIGTKMRSEHTVIGDSVNLASRLENETKKFKVNILICEATYNLVFADFYCREIDTVSIKGISDPIKIYTVVRDKSVPYSKKEKLLNQHYSMGLNYYYIQNYQESFKHFKFACSIDKSDGPSKLFMSRCIELISIDVDFKSENEYNRDIFV